MRKSIFLAGAIVWTVIALAALAILLVTLSGAGVLKNLPAWARAGSLEDAFDVNTKLIKEEKYALSDITELDISTRYQSVKITLIDGGEMAVRHYDVESAEPFASEVSGGRLRINIPQRNFVSLLNMVNPRLEIDLPRGYSASVKLESSSGSINLDGHAEWGAVSLAASSGDVRFADGLKCGDLNIDTSSGSINMGAIDAESLKSVSASGKQRLGELRVSGDISIKTTSGSINSENITAANLTLGSASGDIRIGDANVAGHTEIASSSGSHNAGLVSASSYNITGVSGDLRYGGLSGAGGVDSSSGSINCGALDVKGDVSVSSASGAQRLTLAPGQNFEIKITTASGAIRAPKLELYYSDKNGKNAFGTVGDGSGSGGGTLSLRSASGSVSIE